MKLFHLHTARRKGSVLVFSLLILSIMLVTALTILSSALLNQKAALSTGNSARSFNVANSGVEKMLYEIYKENRATPNHIASAVGGACSNGVISFDIVGGTAKVSLYQSDTTVLASCADAAWRDKVVKIKSEGTLGASSRAVEVAVARCKSTYSVGSVPQGVAFDPTTNSIWVVNSTSNDVTKLRASDGQLLGTYAVGNAPQEIIIDPAPSGIPSVWVTNYGSDTVTKLRASDGQLLGTYAAGTDPWGIAVDATTNPSSIWVTNLAAAGSVTKLRASDGQLLGTYSANAVMPYGIAFDPSTSPNSIWVSSVGFSVSKLNASSGAFINSYAGVTAYYGVVFDPSTDSIWASGIGGGNSLTKFRSSNGSVLGSYSPDGSSSQGMYTAFDSSTNSILVNMSNQITKIRASNGSSNGSYTLPAPLNPTDLIFDSSTGSIWVTSSASNSVTKISTTCGS